MIREEVWDQMLEAECLVRYYDTLTKRYRNRHKWLRAFILFDAMLAIGFLLKPLDPIASVIVGVLLAVAVVWDVIADYASKIALLSIICMECMQVLNDLRFLWEDVDQEIVDEPTLRQRSHALTKKLTDVTSRAIPANISGPKALYEKEAEEAYQVMMDRYYVEEPHPQ